MSKRYLTAGRKSVSGAMKILSLNAIRVLVLSCVLAISLSGCTKQSYTSTATSEPTITKDCTPGYDPCLPPMADYDCKGGQGDGPGFTGRVEVSGDDRYGLDRDRNGIGCG